MIEEIQCEGWFIYYENVTLLKGFSASLHA